MRNSITLTQEQLTKLIESAVSQALAQTAKQSKAVSDTKTSSKKTTSSKKKAPKASTPITRDQALTQAYGSKAKRTKFVNSAKADGVKFLKDFGLVEGKDFNVTFGKVTFVPFKELVCKKFANKSAYSQFREDFRKQFPYA